VAVDELVSDLAYWHVMDWKREGTMNGGILASDLAILKRVGRCHVRGDGWTMMSERVRWVLTICGEYVMNGYGNVMKEGS
jgi:hypothetical protein